MTNFETKTKIVVLYASKYSMPGDNGTTNSGISVNYLYGDNLAPTMSPDGSLGQRPAKGSLPVACWDAVKQVPGIYDGVFTMAISKDGKPTLKLVDLQYIGEAHLETVAPVTSQKK